MMAPQIKININKWNIVETLRIKIHSTMAKEETVVEWMGVYLDTLHKTVHILTKVDDDNFFILFYGISSSHTITKNELN